MRNKFAGTCYRCGKTVEVGQGHFERHRGAWRVQHAECAIKHRWDEVKKEIGWDKEGESRR